jgi:hypothetical protein
MLIFDRENWPKHRPWAISTAAILVGCICWYLVFGFQSGEGEWEWPGGASPPGFAFGVVGGAIILFEMLLWPRKYLWRGRRLGRTKYWMLAHIWLGTLSMPLLLLHGGFHFGLGRSVLAAVLMWLMLFVFLSGLLGAALQHILPRVMLDQIPAETIYGQIRDVLAHYRREAQDIVEAICGTLEKGTQSPGLGTAGDIAMPFRVGGSILSTGPVQGKVVTTDARLTIVPGSESLQIFFRDHVDPYLTAKSGTSLPLGRTGKARALFHELKLRIKPETHIAIERLQELCDQRRQFDLQARLHRLLHFWMAAHLALSVAVLVLMFVHAYLGLEYH